MAVVHLTQASVGAPRNSGTNGDLCVLLDWALVQNGWSIEYSSGNKRVYRPGTGNRFRLYVEHDSAVSGFAGLATVRGYEVATSISALTRPFPTLEQVPNTLSNWLVSDTASTATRQFQILVGETFVFYVSTTNGTTSVDFGFFGDVGGSLPEDNWATIIAVRNNVSTSVPQALLQTASGGLTSLSSNGIFWARDITGVHLSTRGHPTSSSGTSLGVSAGGPRLGTGYKGRIPRSKIPLVCSGWTNQAINGYGGTGVYQRGWWPNIWIIMQTLTNYVLPYPLYYDAAYDPAAAFSPVHYVPQSRIVFLEVTDTWAPPIG